jgi:hypothetical protein
MSCYSGVVTGAFIARQGRSYFEDRTSSYFNYTIDIMGEIDCLFVLSTAKMQ